MLEHFIYSSSSKPATSPLCSPYYRYSSEVSSSFCILSFLVIATSIDQTFYPATHYLAAVWLDSRHGPNIKLRIRLPHDTGSITHSSHSYRRIESKEICLPGGPTSKDKNNTRGFIESTGTYGRWIARRSTAHSVASVHLINRIDDKEPSWIA